MALILFWAAPARAEALVADLTNHLIAITTGFTGASVVLFGAIDGPGDVAVVVRGPDREITVRRKSRIAGIWVNSQEVIFANVPSFYFVAASRPLEEIVSPATAAFYRLGVTNLEMKHEGTPPQVAEEFVTALVRTQQHARLFPNSVSKVNFIGERLFRTTIEFPSNVPTGTYLVQVFLVRDKDVVGGQTTPLVVSKVGIDADVFGFAGRQPAVYGAIAVLTAMVAGWLASLPFRSA
ncbi:MAG TPA: TIGR02186 family protein [Stellaceae bacterium]|jgi:uncharacterized protein (TIGR02186 family)|nr:TIGR02186 family protein [Stellaceae bacterium]